MRNMATMAEGRMNLAALQQRDPYISSIVDTASQVALYSFSSKSNEWEKTDVEGTLFVYTRSASPINGFMILNRLGLHDLIEPINKNLEFQLQDPFLLYKNAQAIYGIWFYDKDECARIGQLMNSLVQVAIETQDRKDTSAGRQRRASESDTLMERTDIMGSRNKNVNILEMLSKAQDEYDKGGQPKQINAPNKSGASSKKSEPKPMIDNPNASATKSASLIKPRALKVSLTQEQEDPGGATCMSNGASAAVPVEPTTPTTQISLDALFRRASMQQGAGPPENQVKHPPPVGRSQSVADSRAMVLVGSQSLAGNMPLLLQRLMSNPGTTVEEIERHQRGEILRDQMPQPAGAEAPSGGNLNGLRLAPSPTQQDDSDNPLSPDSTLKRTLNILPFIPPNVSRSGDGVSAAGPSYGVGAVPKTTLSSIPPANMAHVMTSSNSSFSTALPGASLMDANRTSAAGLPVRHSPPANTVRSVSGVSPEPSGGMVVTSGSVPGRSTMLSQSAPQGALREALLKAEVGQPGGSGSTVSFTAGPSQVSSSSASGSAGKLLLTPSAFETPARVTPPLCSMLPPPAVFQTPGFSNAAKASSMNVGLHPSSTDHPPISPLTKDQMQQAMLYLLRNDPSFLSTLHEAYVKSLHEVATHPRQ